MRFYPHEKLKVVCNKILSSLDIEASIAHEVAECLIETSLRGIDTHGINLLPHYVKVIRSGRINKKPKIRFNKKNITCGVLDADHTFGHAAASFAMKEAIKMSDEAGAGFVVVKNSTHFSACSYYSLQAARRDMIGISATNTDSIMIPTRGSKPYLGTNPISFAFPCKDEEPICLDMATTQVTWNKVKKAKIDGIDLDGAWAIDSKGTPTKNPQQAIGLSPVGLHKGYGLALVVEVLCSMLTDGPFGPYIPAMFGDSLSEKRYLSHFLGAIKISNFIDIDLFKTNIKKMVMELRSKPTLDTNLPILVAGDPEKIFEKKRLREGIPVEDYVVDQIKSIIEEQGLSEQITFK